MTEVRVVHASRSASQRSPAALGFVGVPLGLVLAHGPLEQLGEELGVDARVRGLPPSVVFIVQADTL